jgi:hypothetical protein
MIKNDRRHLLFMEPQMTPTRTPTIDSLTKTMTAAFRRRVVGPNAYHGYHVCSCGATSDNLDHYIMYKGIPVLTNSLCIHYLAFHRMEVPPDEIMRVQALLLFYGEDDPLREELAVPQRGGRSMHQA